MTATAKQLLQEGRYDEVWQNYCGFLDLEITEIMDIQRSLLNEQLDLLSKCELGQKILQGAVPKSAEEFLESVPLTTYKDYESFLLEKNEGALPEDTYTWVRTSGRSGEYPFKWVPYTKRFWERSAHNALAALLMGSATKKGEVVLQPEDTVFFTLAPRPYMSGELMVNGILNQFPFKFLPPAELAEKMDFYERIEKGMQLSLSEGIDVFYGLASILVAIGKKFEEGSGSKKGYASLLLKPQALARLIKGMMIARREKRPLLPRDIFKPKVLAMGGMDCDVFRDAVKYYWGGNPIEGYGLTEAGFVSCQTWNRTGQVIFPDANFYEFIPFDEHVKLQKDPNYKPKSLMMDQLKVGEIYEIVITNLLGGPFVRYRIGDLVTVTALEDNAVNVKIPHIKFYSRSDDLIDIAGFTRLTEFIIWKAIQESGIPYTDWVVKKESENNVPIIHIYLDSGTDIQEEQAAEKIHNSLSQLDNDYANVESLLGVKPIKVSFFKQGAFARYMEKMKDEGADLAHLKPPRMNPKDHMMEKLLN